MDALRPVGQAFAGSDVLEKVRDALCAACSEAEAAKDDSKVLHLVSAFALVDATRSLRFAKGRIEAMGDPLPPADPGKFDARSGPVRPSIPSILESFARVEIADARAAVELLLRYLERVPGQAPTAS